MGVKPEIIKQPLVPQVERDISLPLASIVIVNLNQGHYLNDCILSVVNQSYKNLEIILQDGGSNDESLEILKKYPQINLVSETDFSSGHAFAKASSRASGDFLFFLNSSDGFYSKSWVEDAVTELQKSVNVSMVTGSVVGVDSDSTLNSYYWPKNKVNQKISNFYSWLFDGFGFTPISFGVKTEVFKACSAPQDRFIDPKDPNSIDFFWYFSEKFFSKGYVSISIEKVAAFVRIHSDRVDDSAYLARQLAQLNLFIKRFRRELLFGYKKHRFIDSESREINNEKFRIEELWKYYLMSKIRHLFFDKLQKKVTI